MIEKLEEHWEDILREYKSVRSTQEYFEKDLYTGSWEVFPFLFFDQEFPDHQEACPRTWELLSALPGLVNASFSIMRPGTEIQPHTGFTNQVRRYHLGLEIPEACAITIAGQDYQWIPGKLFNFDDTKLHSAYNRSDRDRAILLFDLRTDSLLSQAEDQGVATDLQQRPDH